ncbi:AraC family transcriptional regulator [Hellea sp.]|nr:AraC family transcriptional regulator [Hellea sp.]
MPQDQTYTRAVALLGLPEFIKKHGGNAKALFYEAGLDIEAGFNPQDLINWPRACVLLELTAKTLNLPNLGLRWAQFIPDDMPNTGPNVYLAALMPDVATLVEMAIRYQKLHTNGAHYSYERDSVQNRVTGSVDFHPETPACRQYAEHIMAIICLGVKRIIGETYCDPLEVSFQHSQPADLSWHQKIFNCPIVFDAERTSMSYDIRILDHKMGRKLPLFKTLLGQYLKRQQKKLPKTSTPIKTAITGLIPYALATGKSDIISVAHVLGMSPKKVQRLLKQEGATYSLILDDVRSRSAKRLLLESNIPITRIAHMLDYSSSRPFGHACKRWFDTTPLKYRRENR